MTTFTDEDEEKPYADADVAIFLGSMPRRPGMDRHEVYEINAEIFQKQGKYLDAAAKKTCKSLVIANPVLYIWVRLVRIVWFWQQMHLAFQLKILQLWPD